jgi:hypothetical protein
VLVSSDMVRLVLHIALKVMKMKTQIISSNWSQNATTPPKELVDAIREANTAEIRWEEAKRKAVRLVLKYRESLPRGLRKKGVEDVCRQAGIDDSTFYRWKAEVEEDREIGDEILREAKKERITITTPLRKELLRIRQEQPNDSARKVLSDALESCKSRQEKSESSRSKACKAMREYLLETKGKSDQNTALTALVRDVYPDYNPCGESKA